MSNRHRRNRVHPLNCCRTKITKRKAISITVTFVVRVNRPIRRHPKRPHHVWRALLIIQLPPLPRDKIFDHKSLFRPWPEFRFGPAPVNFLHFPKNWWWNITEIRLVAGGIVLNNDGVDFWQLQITRTYVLPQTKTNPSLHNLVLVTASYAPITDTLSLDLWCWSWDCSRWRRTALVAARRRCSAAAPASWCSWQVTPFWELSCSKPWKVGTTGMSRYTCSAAGRTASANSGWSQVSGNRLFFTVRHLDVDDRARWKTTRRCCTDRSRHVAGSNWNVTFYRLLIVKMWLSESV